MTHRLRSLRAASMAGALLAAGAAHAAAAADLVLGRSTARACYESALFHYDSRNALEECDQALEGALARRDRAATHINRGIVRLLRGDLDGALADYEKAASMRSPLPEADLNTALVRLRQERPHEALESLDRALAVPGKHAAKAHFIRGQAFELLEDAASAYEAYREAQRLAPEWGEPKRELERFQVVKGDNGA